MNFCLSSGVSCLLCYAGGKIPTALNYRLQIVHFKRYLTQGMEDTKPNSSHAGFRHLINDLNNDFKYKII